MSTTKFNTKEIHKVAHSINGLNETLRKFDLNIQAQLDDMNWNDDLRSIFDKPMEDVIETVIGSTIRSQEVYLIFVEKIKAITELEELANGLLTSMNVADTFANNQGTSGNASAYVSNSPNAVDHFADIGDADGEVAAHNEDKDPKGYEHENIARIKLGVTGLTVADIGRTMEALDGHMTPQGSGIEIIECGDYALEITPNTESVLLTNSHGETIISVTDGEFDDIDNGDETLEGFNEELLLEMLRELKIEDINIQKALGPDTFGDRGNPTPSTAPKTTPAQTAPSTPKATSPAQTAPVDEHVILAKPTRTVVPSAELDFDDIQVWTGE